MDQGWPSQDGSMDVASMIARDLTPEERKSMLGLLREYKDVFAEKAADLTGAKVEPIRLTTRTDEPVAVRMRRYSQKEKEAMKREVDQMLEDGVIRRSKSPYQASVLLVPKKDTVEPRFCVDYRPLNAVTVTEVYPLPRIDDILDSLAGAKLFSKLDLKSGYWQLPLDESTMEKTAFSTDCWYVTLTRYQCRISRLSPTVNIPFAGYYRTVVNGQRAVGLGHS